MDPLAVGGKSRTNKVELYEFPYAVANVFHMVIPYGVTDYFLSKLCLYLFLCLLVSLVENLQQFADEWVVFGCLTKYAVYEIGILTRLHHQFQTQLNCFSKLRKLLMCNLD